MKAIVLTFDKYKVFTDHMIYTYMTLWSDNQFIFVVPYQNEETKTYYEKKYGDKVELIKSPSDIVGTMETLLNHFEDDEWIYWCIDDKYLINIDINEMQKIYNWITHCDDTKIAAVKVTTNLFYTSLSDLHYFKYKIKNNYGQLFFRRKNYGMIWNHQFLRVKVLKDIFQHMPKKLGMAKEMDWILDNMRIPDSYFLYSYKKSIMQLEESTTKGKISRSCYQSLLKYGFEVPENFEVNNDYSIISGEKINIFNVVFFNITHYTKEFIRYLFLHIGFRKHIEKRDVLSERIPPRHFNRL